MNEKEIFILKYFDVWMYDNYIEKTHTSSNTSIDTSSNSIFNSIDTSSNSFFTSIDTSIFIDFNYILNKNIITKNVIFII